MKFKHIDWNKVLFGEKEDRKRKFRKALKSNLIEFAIALVLFAVFMGSRWAYNNGLLDREAVESRLSELAPSDITISSEIVSSSEDTSVSDASTDTTKASVILSVNDIDFDKISDDTLVIELNNGVPYFTDDELSLESFERYSDLDNLGRCGVAFACLSQDMMPEKDSERGDISEIKPSGWKSIPAEDVDKGWLYNRSHLIAWALTGQNANSKNLVTGTRQFNSEAMLPNEVAVEEVLDANPKLHIMYRVTPVYVGNELVCRGVVMEAFSVEDNGSAISYCFFIPNVQKGWQINYLTGVATRKET